MREETMEQGHQTTTLFSSEHANRVDITESLSPADSTMAETRRRGCSNSKRKQLSLGFNTKTAALLSIIATAPLAMAQSCISLSGSTQCPAFSSASISTSDSTLLGYFPFLKFVSDLATFDEQLSSYVSQGYVLEKYQILLNCSNVNLSNTTNLYARFTTSVICNSIIQNSKAACSLSAAASEPLCAITCADQASSESIIIADNALCSNPSSNAQTQIRADFTNCALPASSLSTCIEGAANEPNNCGFGNSTIGLCQYCGAGGQNSTDTCCYNSKADTLCAGVVLPSISGYMTFATSSPTSSSTASPTSSKSPTPIASTGHTNKGLSGGAIAGIAIGSIAGAAILAVLIFLLILCFRRRRPSSAHGSLLNQPTPARKPQGMAYNPVSNTATTPEGYEVLPGGRIARMSALEGHTDSATRNATLLSAASGAGYGAGRTGRRNHESSSDEGYSPISNQMGVLRPPPTARRTGSLSSGSMLNYDDAQSPRSASGGDMSSPQGLASQQSEQLPFFKDYYSSDEIHPGDRVATLWAYQPRAGDEFSLERGDMLKVVGIWDDGWATGVLIDEKAENWEAKRMAQRDSGVSNTSGRRDDSPNVSGEIKAFPLVCVCLPDHWRKTIEGDGSTETGSSVPYQGNL